MVERSRLEAKEHGSIDELMVRSSLVTHERTPGPWHQGIAIYQYLQSILEIESTAVLVEAPAARRTSGLES